MKTLVGRGWALFGVLLLVVLLAGSAISQAAPGGSGTPAKIKTATDAAKGKLDKALAAKVAGGSNATVPVFVSMRGDTARAEALLSDAHATAAGEVSLVVGRIPAQQSVKLAGLAGVVSVGLVQFKRDGQPLGFGDPELGVPASGIKNAKALWSKNNVPYDKAPPLKASNFGALAGKGYLDAKTHNFDGAWSAGYTGAGVTAAVLDGGTDFGHPDLLNTWQTWTNAPDPGWNGWPKAFDPYDTLVLLLAPDFIDEGLTWYTRTTAAPCAPAAGSPATCSVKFATRLGPSRNISAPDAKIDHQYRFPSSWSKSGVVRLGSHPDDHLLQLYGERPAFLVTDPHTAGVYDTVYVDLNDDYSFADEKPITKSSPASYRDMNGDGYTDLSGGLLYYISDGNTLIPGGPTTFGVGDKPAPGAFLAWSGDFDPAIEGHGTLTASNVVGQAVVNGKAPTFADFGKTPGAVLGGAPNAKLAPFGDIYFSFAFSTEFGYYLTTRNGVDVTSNSYGSSDVDNDGFDAASQEADVIHAGRPNTTPVFSTGNGAPGYGTTTPPSPVAGINVGASTNFGGTGWDSIANLSQVADNDVIEWSNRGPGATAKAGVDLVADGAYAPGDATLNTVLDGRNAWETWGGTSRSTPVVVGATALVYQAYEAAHSGAKPTQAQVKDFLKSSATDLGYDSFTQGSGSLNAGGAADAAKGAATSVAPDQWRAGNYRGTKYSVFPRLLAPGGSDTQSFALSGGSGTWNVSSRVLKRVATNSFPFTSKPVSQESVSNFNAPDYLVDLSSQVAAHPNADLMVVHANYAESEFDGNKDYNSDQAWRLLAYKWNDVNHDGKLWTDANGNGIVDHTVLPTSSNIDGFNDIDFAHSEMEQGEYVRYMYHRPGANELTVMVRDPAHRGADGLFLALQHSARNANIPITHFNIRVDFYENQPWSWVTAPATAAAGTSFNATLTVPSGTPYGMYQGAVVLSQASKSIVIPTSVAVAATQAQDPTTHELIGSTTFGGPAAEQPDELYDNGSFFGANDWTWRSESGDWRFFFLDVPAAPPTGSLFLANTSWGQKADPSAPVEPSPPTDLDTLIFGRSANSFQVFDDAVFGAPYILGQVGGSPNTDLGSGKWGFDTATGGPEDLVTAPAQEGLHEIALHGVGFDGAHFNVPFKTVVAGAAVNPDTVVSHTADGTGSFDVHFKAGLDLAGFNAEAFGLSQPVTKPEVVHQDNPDDPSTASVKENVTITHASRATFTVDVGTDDVDLFVVHNGQIVASSTGPAGADESVTLIRPEDGQYQIWLHGFSVAGTPTVPLGIDIVQGSDLHATVSPSGPLPAGTPVTVHVTYSKAGLADGSYKGDLLMGPPSAPTAINVPVTVIKP